MAPSRTTSQGLHGSEALPSAAVSPANISPANISPSAFPHTGAGRWTLKRYLKALGDVHGLQWDVPPEQHWDPGRDLWLQLFSLV